MLVKLGIALTFANVAFGGYRQTADVQGVTYANQKGEVFVPIRELGTALGWYVGWNDEAQQIELNEKPVPREALRKLWDGTNMMSISHLSGFDVTVDMDQADRAVTIKLGDREVTVEIPPKYVQVSLKHQELRAWQGTRQVMMTNVCSGGPGNRTPMGSFKTGPAKNRHHYSRLYNNSYMPFAVQINGNIFIHGYKSVPRRPSSHGCIRMPLTGQNAARYFFDWVDLRVPVDVVDDWTEVARNLMGEAPISG